MRLRNQLPLRLPMQWPVRLPSEMSRQRRAGIFPVRRVAS
jgi:hypothetical protein